MSFRVFRQKRVVNGKSITNSTWSGRYRLSWMPRERSISLKTSDKGVAEKRMREFIKREDRIHAGLPVPLGLWGEPPRDTADIIQDYLEYLNSKRAKPQYIRDTGTHLNRLVKECGWATVDLINADSLDHWLRKDPLSLKTKKPLAAKTKNEYITSAKAMMNWLIRLGRITTNPLEYFEKIPTAGAKVKKRRSWSMEDIKTLYDSGVYYGLAILLGAHTGLRRNEIQTLCWADVHLDGDLPFVKPRSENTKNSKSQPIPLHWEIVLLLKTMRPNDYKPSQFVLNFQIPKMDEIKRDLEKLGITYRDDLGRDIDFHALRKTFTTRVTQTGASTKQVQMLSRHESAELAANIYTDSSQIETSSIVSKDTRNSW